jgi:hypothetical protein
LACECACPVCGGALVAKKGERKVHHFAHASGADCEAAYETALHKAAKELLLEHRRIALPAVEIRFDQRRPILLKAASTYELDGVELETRFGGTVPDVTASVGGKPLFIEIRVTHAVDEVKLAKIKAQDVSTVEVDLSNVDRNTSLDTLKSLLIEQSPTKTWLHNAYAQNRHTKLVAHAPPQLPVQRGMATHIDGCPLPARRWNGKPYANLVDNCLGCRYGLAFPEGLVGPVHCAAFNPDCRSEIDALDSGHRPAETGDSATT